MLKQRGRGMTTDWRYSRNYKTGCVYIYCGRMGFLFMNSYIFVGVENERITQGWRDNQALLEPTN